MKTFVVILAGLGCLAGKCWALEPQWQEISRGEVRVESVLAHQGNPKVIFMGTRKGIFKTEDGGGSWRRVYALRGDNQAINYLAADMQDQKTVYAATGAGLFVSSDEGERWRRLFRGKDRLENDCTAVLSLPGIIYAGTKRGLFTSKDKGCSWRKEEGKLAESRIFNLAYNARKPDYIYVSCVDGLYRSADNAVSWERIYATHPVENGLEVEEGDEERDEDERHSEIRYAAIDPLNPENIYLATTRGIFCSKAGGSGWALLSEYGLLGHDAHILVFSPQSRLYAVSKAGIFIYQQSGWRELSFRLSCRYVNFLALDNNGNLYACTEKGLFRAGLDAAVEFAPGGLINEYCRGEPEIADVQRQAIKYAEVEPEKIINWRKQAAKRAMLPKVSMGIARDNGDLWHWESGSSTRECDDTLRRGRDSLDWDVSLSWDLGELIWNADQTSIDTRSRLMVQLRDDILDEVNKLYFERIRVKMELDALQIEDRKKRFEKELRLRELTASLDGLTGGYFSGQIRQK